MKKEQINVDNEHIHTYVHCVLLKRQMIRNFSALPTNIDTLYIRNQCQT